MSTSQHPLRGLSYAFIAFFSWGMIPLYWKQIKHFGSLELLGHRILWGVVLLCPLLLFQGKFPQLKKIMSEPKTLKVLFLSTALIGINWLTFIWGVNNGHLVETSLGYFINPLVSVFLGVFVLKERLRIAQWVAVALAFVAVMLLLGRESGEFWISLSLAFTFGLYGLVRKLVRVDSFICLFFEMSVLLLPAIFYLVYLGTNNQLIFLQTGYTDQFLACLAGAVTLFPLSFFIKSVEHLRLSTVGLMQYIAPSFQLFLGVWLYGEAFGAAHWLSFSLIWIALAIYSFDSLYFFRK